MRYNLVLLGCAVWIWLVGSCLGLRYVVGRENLEVIWPESLKGFYESSTGSFGIPKYGGSVVGTVVYPKVNQKGCLSFGRFGISYRTTPEELPIILLVDRGDCFFTLKVYNAQKAGAAAILIVDSVDRPLITMESSEENFGNNYFVSKIDIPSALISKSFGNRIKEALSMGDFVDIKLLFNSPREAGLPPNERIKYEMWISANLGCGSKCHEQLEFLKNFKEVARMFEERGYTRFTPHYMTWYCPEAFILSKQCKSECLNYGRYCAPDFDTWGNGGKDVVYQSLIQSCFYKVAKKRGTPWLWWDYVIEFASKCTTLNSKVGLASCRDQVIGRLGFETKEVYECVGDTEADKEHPILAAEQKARVGGLGPGKEVTILPTLVINNRQYRGRLVKEEVVKAICSQIREQATRPDICPKEDTAKDNVVVLKNDQLREGFYKEDDHLSSEESNFGEGMHKQWVSSKKQEALANTHPGWGRIPSINGITSSGQGRVVEAINKGKPGPDVSSSPSRELGSPPQVSKLGMGKSHDDLEVGELALVWDGSRS